MDRRVTSPKQVTSRTWGLPPPCKQPLMFVLMHVSTEETLRSLSKLLPSISSEHLCFCVPLICLHWHHSSAKKLDTQMNTGEYNSLDIQTGFRKKTSTFLGHHFSSFLCNLLYPVHRHYSFSTMKIQKCRGMTDHPKPQLAFAIALLAMNPYMVFSLFWSDQFRFLGKYPPTPPLSWH